MDLDYPEAKLRTACQVGDVKKVEELLDKGVDIEQYEDCFDESPLITAIKNKNETIINLLLQRGSNINAIDCLGEYPIHVAAECGDGKLFEYLLEKGANIDQKDKDGKTPLFYAVENNNGPMVEMLIEKGCNINTQDNRGRTSVHYASEIGHLEIVRTLLIAGSGVDLQDIDGRTPLFMAADKDNSCAVIELLLNKGARINMKDKYGITPLFRAIELSNFKNVKYLLNSGAFIYDIPFFQEDIFHEEFPNNTYKVKKTKTILKKYLIKLLVANIRIDIFTVIFKFNLDDIDCGRYEESCMLEVDKMKIKKFGGVSLYDVLIKTVNPMFADNNEIEQFISSSSLKEQFPKYAALIKLKFQEAKKRNNSIKFTVFNMKCNVSEIVTLADLPHVIKWEICCYLSNEDLEILKVALQDAY